VIYLECYADEVLVKTLGIPRKERRHEGGRGEVCNRLKENKNTKGLVDEDPGSRQPCYMQTLTPHSNEQDIKVFYDKNAGNYLLVLCSKLEGWILNAARKAKIDVKQYGLPDDEDELHEIGKNKKKLGALENLLNDLKPKSEALKTLEKLLKGS
jgi:hypothetical protein